MSTDYVVEIVDDEEDDSGPFGVVKVIWYEISGGIGPWGALRPLIAIILALIPFFLLVSISTDNIERQLVGLEFNFH